MEYMDGVQGWSTGIEYSDGVSELSTGMEYRDGVSELSTGMEYRDGVHGWSTGMEYILHPYTSFSSRPVQCTLYLSIVSAEHSDVLQG